MKTIACFSADFFQHPLHDVFRTPEIEDADDRKHQDALPRAAMGVLMSISARLC